jgi:hypothetical protein
MIIGAKTPEDVLTIDGRRFIKSKNGVLYDTNALKESAPRWEGIKVYDNHLTNEEFERKQGMRSPATEWLGTIVNTRWDDAKAQLRGVFKVVEEKLAAKLKAAYDHGVLSTIGLSIDTITKKGQDVFHEGQRFPVYEGFKRIHSVDLVAEPAAGGQFERLIAATIDKEINNMGEANAEFITRDEFKKVEQKWETALADALAAKEADIDLDGLTDEEVKEALRKIKEAEEEEALSEAELELQKVKVAASKARQEADHARTDLMIERKLEAAKLPEKFEDMIRSQFKDRIVEADTVDAAIKLAKVTEASYDPSGKVKAGGQHEITVGLIDEERLELELSRLVMGTEAFRELENHKDVTVKERVLENKAYQSWLHAGKPDLPHYPRMSSLLYDFFGGDPVLSGRALEAATTSTLSTAVKNTVNIMAANAYSKRELWWEPIVTTHEVDTIDDSTLARVYGASALSTVPEGAAYTELQMADEEETASFVKRGNFIGVTLETLMRDKIQQIQRIPTMLANSWYNTQSDLVANVFMTNSTLGPVLGTSGALFNNTAVGTPGGHANLLTTALSHAQYIIVRTAMRKQTDQPLGVGRRLLLTPKYVLVPIELEATALQIRNSELQSGADMDNPNSGAQSINPLKGSFEVIIVPQFTEADHWAVVADPIIAPAIHLIYPRGQRAPQIFSADGETSGAMFTNDELRFKVRLMTYRFSSTYDCAPVSDFRPLHRETV